MGGATLIDVQNQLANISQQLTNLQNANFQSQINNSQNVDTTLQTNINNILQFIKYEAQNGTSAISYSIVNPSVFVFVAEVL